MPEIEALLRDILASVLAVAAVVIPLLASYHIVTSKEDVRAAIGWTGLVWLVPFLGTLFYILFGINRVQRKARRARGKKDALHTGDAGRAEPSVKSPKHDGEGRAGAHVRLANRVSPYPMLAGNGVGVLKGGRATFSAMEKAIEGAGTSIALSSYIFAGDEAGRPLVDALGRAVKRGLRVRVLVDGLGELYHWPLITRLLRRAGVPYAVFNRTFFPWRMGVMNMRSHRKLLIVDGRTGFTGGINIRKGHILEEGNRRAVRDVHFRLDGPVVASLMDCFAEDWEFTTGETLDGPDWFPEDLQKGSSDVLARAVADGPDSRIERIRWIMLSALDMAQKDIRVMTPYFLPDRLLIGALNHAAYRGVDVRIIVPEKNNLPYVSWAAQAQYAQMLSAGVRIFHSTPPFDHSKIMVVDRRWSLFGSTNWDARSLRLNFELNVEAFDEELARDLAGVTDAALENAREITLADTRDRSILRRSRDGFFWLLSPYL